LGYFNILPLYVVLMASAPFIALCFRYAPHLLLPLSLGIYAIALGRGINLPTWPIEGTWFLNPLAWQLLYVLGFLVAASNGLGGLVRRHRKTLFFAALPIAVLGVIVAFTRFSPKPIDVPDPRLFFMFDKTFLSPARLVHMLALVVIFAGSFKLLNRWFAVGTNFFSLLGRNSLYVFCVGSLLSLVGQILRFAYGGAFLIDAIILVLGLGVMGFVAWLSDWRDRLRAPVSGMRASPSPS